MILEAKNICKNYGDETILQDVCLRLGEGESVAVTGASGCGKSTLVSILGLLLAPDGGELLLDGTDLLALDDRRRSQIRNRHFGFIFQSTQLIGSLTALDNVLVPAHIAGERGLEKPARELLARFGLGERLYHYPHQLSIGQKRRACLARALLLAPQFIFADEPTNDLDPAIAAEIGDCLFDLPAQGRTLLLVTHDHTLATRAARHLHFDGHHLQTSKP